MKEFIKRTVTGLILLGVLFFFLFYLRPLCIRSLDILILAFMGAGLYEMYNATKLGGHKTMLIPIIVFGVLVYPLFFLFSYFGKGATGDSAILIALIVSSAIALVQLTFSLEKKEELDEDGNKTVVKVHKYTIKDVGATILTIIYPGVFTSIFFAVNLHAGDLIAILLCLIVPLVDDALAYFVGSKFGKHKLCPSISPKKSVEGLIGGIVGGLIATVGIFLLFDQFGVFDNVKNVLIPRISDKLYVSLPIYFVLGSLIIACEFAGDLVASRIKRLVGIKDYGKIFPGHGGVMDRLDSLIFSLPIVYIFFSIARVAGLLY